MSVPNVTVGPGIVSDIRGKVRGAVCIIGIGNIMRGDDGCGPKLIETLKSKKVKASLLDCGTVPENYIFPILSTSCDTLILVDAADLGMEPGAIKVLLLNEISASGLSTHNSSLRLFTDLLLTGKENLNIFAVSIQPGTIAFGSPLSDKVKAAIETLSAAFGEALS